MSYKDQHPNILLAIEYLRSLTLENIGPRVFGPNAPKQFPKEAMFYAGALADNIATLKTKAELKKYLTELYSARPNQKHRFALASPLKEVKVEICNSILAEAVLQELPQD